MHCYYSDDFFMELPHGHPFPMDKFRVSKEMLLQENILKPEEIIEVNPVASRSLLRVHDEQYLQRIERGLLDRKEQISIGLPWTPELYNRCATEVEATRLACFSALEEGASVCLGGGSHHASHKRGEGYCVFNDVAIAIRDLQLVKPGIKIMVVDTDAHQGNGTNSILASDPNVYTYSIHVGSNNPAKKVKGSLDVETVRYVEGEMYLNLLFSSLAIALEKFSPDLIIWVSGADNHINDRFGQMALTVNNLQHRDDVLLRAFLGNRIPTAILYGGGYNRDPEATSKIHRNTIATAKRILSGIRWRK